MNFDEVIKGTLKNNTSILDISNDRCDEMFEHIYEQAATKNKSIISEIFKITSTIINALHVKDVVEVLIFIAIIIVIPIVVTSNKNTVYNNHISSNLQEETTISNLENYVKEFPSPSKIDGNEKVRNQVESYVDMNIIKEKVSFVIDYPKFIPKGYSLQGTNLVKFTDTTMDVLNLHYSNTEKQYILIQQQQKVQISEDLKKISEKITINNIDAWISTSTNKALILVFTRNNKFYQIVGTNIDKQILIKIAESI
jgi:hypothetical protein